MHEWDGQTRLEETLSALDSLVAAGKVRYLAASNYAGWQLMKALAVADARGYERFAAQQVYYSLEARDAEYELVPLVGRPGARHPRLVAAGRRPGVGQVPARRVAVRADRQLSGEWNEPPVRDQEKLYDTIEVLVDIAAAHGASPAQVALAWLLGRPAVTSLIIGARTEEQLRDNLGRGRAHADRRRARGAGQGQRARPGVPALAPARHGQGPPRPRRPRAARAAPQESSDRRAALTAPAAWTGSTTGRAPPRRR